MADDPLGARDPGRISKKSRARRANIQTNIQRRLTRSLTNTRTVFYELGASSTATECGFNQDNNTSNRVTISIPRRLRGFRTIEPPRRTLTASSSGSSSSGSSSGLDDFLLCPLEQRRCQTIDEEDEAYDSWRWATQLPSDDDDDDDDWRWRSQQRSTSWEAVTFGVRS